MRATGPKARSAVSRASSGLIPRRTFSAIVVSNNCSAANLINLAGGVEDVDRGHHAPLPAGAFTPDPNAMSEKMADIDPTDQSSWENVFGDPEALPPETGPQTSR